MWLGDGDRWQPAVCSSTGHQPSISPSYDINVSPEPLNLLLHRAAAADGPPSLWPADWNINPDLDQVNKWWIYYKKEDIGYLNHDGKFRLILNQSTVDVIWSSFFWFYECIKSSLCPMLNTLRINDDEADWSGELSIWAAIKTMKIFSVLGCCIFGWVLCVAATSPAQPEYFLKTEDNSLEMFCPKWLF